MRRWITHHRAMSEHPERPAIHAPRPRCVPYALAAALGGLALSGAALPAAVGAQATPAAPSARDTSRADSTRAASTRPAARLAGVTVVARPYVADRAASATKLDVPLHDTPLTVSTVTRAQLDALAVQSVQESFRYVPGVTAELSGRSGYDEFTVRGFSQSRYQFRDGLRLDPGYLQQQEPFGLEQVDVLKGPASVLYGQVAPGGIVNLVGKQPDGERRRQLEATGGSYGLARAAADVGGALGAGGRWQFRVPALVSRRDDPLRTVGAARAFAAPALAWQPRDGTRLTLLAVLQDDRYARTIGLPVAGTLAPNPNGALDPRTYLGEPDQRRLRSPQAQVGYAFVQRLGTRGGGDTTRAWTLRSQARRLGYSLRGPITYLTEVDSAGRTAGRGGLDLDVGATVWAADTRVDGAARTGAVAHRVLAGVDYLRDAERSAYDALALAPVDLYAPQRGTPVARGDRANDSRTTLTQTGVYGQYRGTVAERLVLVAGARYGDSKTDRRDRLAGTSSVQRDARTVFNAAALLRAPGGFAPYVSYAQSFEPQIGYDPLPDGALAPPAEGAQVEGGVKWESPDRRSTATASAFTITNENLVQSDPGTRGRSVLTGAQRHRGVEAELALRPAAALNVRAGYTYLDAHVTRSVNGDVGDRPFDVPRHAATLLTTVSGAPLGLAAADLTVGARYVGARRGPDATTPVPAYTLADLSLRYRVGRPSAPVTLTAALKNVADRRYYTSAAYGVVVLGEPRTVVVQTAAAFF